MKFLDANIFIYAFYKPKRQLTTLEKRLKDLSKRVVTEVGDGKEAVVTTVVHLSEVVDILKHSFTVTQLGEIVTGLLMLDNVEVLEVGRTEYFAATELGQELGLDPNDALAVQVMRLRRMTEIYSFDNVFEKVDEVTRLSAL